MRSGPRTVRRRAPPSTCSARATPRRSWRRSPTSTNARIRTATDLAAYLLVDVEMSDCDTTSRIAQAIASVQLYMQRVRMGVEAGADTRDIPDAWWSWLATYRMWEANRRIFLYPENYLDPA